MLRRRLILTWSLVAHFSKGGRFWRMIGGPWWHSNLYEMARVLTSLIFMFQRSHHASVLSYFAPDSQSVLALSPSLTPNQILAVVRQLRNWRHGASSLMGGRVCILYSTIYWSLLYLTLSGVFFARPSTGVFFTWPSLYSTLCWSLPVWAILGLSLSYLQLSVSQSVSKSILVMIPSVQVGWHPASTGHTVLHTTLALRLPT